MIIKLYNHSTPTSLNLCMFDWQGENGDQAGKSQVIINH